MAVYTVFSKNITTYYKTTLCSKSSFFFITIGFLTFFLPLLIAYRSQGFWVKQLSYREQPLVRFKQKYLVHVETEDENKPIICTSYSNNNEALEELNKCTLMKFNEADFNGDGKLDQLHMQVNIATNENLSVLSAFVVLVFDYTLQIQCLLRMESIAVVQTSVSFPAKKLTVYGDLNLVQKTLLHCRGRDLRFNQSSFDEETLNIDEVLKENALRNVSTRLDNMYHLWTRGRGDKTFALNIIVNYPETIVNYRPGFWPVMKWAWVQYMAVLVIFLAISRLVKGYVYMNYILPTVPHAPWKKNV